MSYTKSDNRSKNVIIAGLWETRNGHFHSLPVDAKGHDTLQSCLELGGKFLIRLRTKDAINQSRDPAHAPTAYLEFVPKEAVEEFKANKPAGREEVRGL